MNPLKRLRDALTNQSFDSQIPTTNSKIRRYSNEKFWKEIELIKRIHIDGYSVQHNPRQNAQEKQNET